MLRAVQCRLQTPAPELGRSGFRVHKLSDPNDCITFFFYFRTDKGHNVEKYLFGKTQGSQWSDSLEL